jgi:hypothetical protein
VDQELFEKGFTPESTIYEDQDNGFRTSELFDKWREGVLFPDIQRTRGELHYRGPAVAVLDGCSSHRKNNATIHPPPHSSHQTRQMDRGIFAVEKTKPQQCHPPAKLNPQTKRGTKGMTGHCKRVRQ